MQKDVDFDVEKPRWTISREIPVVWLLALLGHAGFTLFYVGRWTDRVEVVIEERKQEKLAAIEERKALYEQKDAARDQARVGDQVAELRRRIETLEANDLGGRRR